MMKPTSKVEVGNKSGSNLKGCTNGGAIVICLLAAIGSCVSKRCDFNLKVNISEQRFVKVVILGNSSSW